MKRIFFKEPLSFEIVILFIVVCSYAICMYIKNFSTVSLCSFLFISMVVDTLSAAIFQAHGSVPWLWGAFNLLYTFVIFCLLFIDYVNVSLPFFFVYAHKSLALFFVDRSSFVNWFHPIIVNAPLIIFMHLSTLLNILFNVAVRTHTRNFLKMEKVQVAIFYSLFIVHGFFFDSVESSHFPI